MSIVLLYPRVINSKLKFKYTFKTIVSHKVMKVHNVLAAKAEREEL